MTELTDKEQQKVCTYCKDFILEGINKTSTFLCEGSWCDEALEKFLDQKEEA